MKINLPLEVHFSDLAVFGMLMFAPAILFFVIGIILLIAKKKKAAKILLILSGIFLLMGLGMCGVSM